MAMLKKYRGLLLALALVLLCVVLMPAKAQAAVASGACGDNLTWTLDEEGTLTISGTGEMSWSGSAPWYTQRADVQKVVIENGVTNIRKSAFSYHPKLTSVEIPESVTTIEESAFYNCSKLASLEIPASVTSIGKKAFANCSKLKTVHFAGDAPAFGTDAFYYDYVIVYYPAGNDTWTQDVCQAYGSIRICWWEEGGTKSGVCGDNLTWTLDSDGLLTISGTGDMYDYANYVVGGTQSPWYNGDCLMVKKIVVEPGATSIGRGAFHGCENTVEVVLPEGILSIGMEAFRGLPLTSIEIPSTVTVMDEAAFAFCASLQSVTLPESLEELGSSAFQGCRALTEIVIPKNVKNIGSYAFQSCTSLKKVVFEGPAPSFGPYDVFYEVTADVYYPYGETTWTEAVRQNYDGTLTWIESDPAGACGDDLNWRYSNGTLTIFGTGDMYDYAIAEDGMTSTAPWGAWTGSITQIVFEEGMTSVGTRAFAFLSEVTEIVLPNSLKTIGANAFQGCCMNSIYIPEGVTAIGDGAFQFGSLKEINIPGSVNSLGEAACADMYLLEKVTIGDGVTTIGDSAFSYCTKLTSVEIPGSVTSIGEGAFFECSGLETVTLSEGLVSIGDYAFQVCSSLTDVTLPSTLTSLGEGAFMECTSLKHMVIPEGITSIDALFYGCTALESVVLPQSLTYIDAYSFNSCEALKEVNLPDSVTVIGGFAFGGCFSLTEVVLPQSLTHIGDCAFNAVPIKEITIPKSVTDIVGWAFSFCKELETITFEGSAPNMEENILKDTGPVQAYYPCGDNTWNSSTMLQYGGTVTWTVYHNYEAEVTEPTYEHGGYTTHTCTGCGDSYVDNEVPALVRTVAMIGEQGYPTVDAALRAANPGDVVRLTDNADESDTHLVIDEGVTLDVGVYVLSARSLTGLSGSYLNAARYGNAQWGRVYVPQNRLILSEAVTNGQNKVIPYWDPNDECYVLANTRIKDVDGAFATDEETKTISFKFSYGAGSAANKDFLIDGAEDNAMTFVVRLQWESENGVAYQDFVYKNEYVSALAQSGGNFTFQLTGYDMLNIDLETFSIQGMIITDSGIIVSGTEYTVL